jgi:hypothetical protein
VDRWSDRGNPAEAGCNDFADPEGETRFLSGLKLTDGVPDAQWPAAVRIVTEIVDPAGFGAPDTVVNKPGEHEVVWRGKRGSRLTFGSAVHATLDAEVGCHLPSAVHDAS